MTDSRHTPDPSSNEGNATGARMLSLALDSSAIEPMTCALSALGAMASRATGAGADIGGGAGRAACS
jgi:hypothetical protein